MLTELLLHRFTLVSMALMAYLEERIGYRATASSLIHFRMHIPFRDGLGQQCQRKCILLGAGYSMLRSWLISKGGSDMEAPYLPWSTSSCIRDSEMD